MERRLFGHLLMASTTKMTKESSPKPEIDVLTTTTEQQQSNGESDHKIVNNDPRTSSLSAAEVSESRLSPWSSCQTGMSTTNAQELREKEFELLLERVFTASTPPDDLTKANAGGIVDDSADHATSGGEGGIRGDEDDDTGDDEEDNSDSDDHENITVLPAGAFCKSPKRHLPMSDLPRPANFDKALKFLRKAKAQREARNAADKELELRNYGTWKVKAGQSLRQRNSVNNDKSWLVRSNTLLNLSSVDSADNDADAEAASNHSVLSSRSHSPPSGRTGTAIKSAPTTPRYRTAIDMLLFPANVSCGTDAGSSSQRGRQVMMARLMSTPDKLPAHRTTTSRKVREDKQRMERERIEEEQERHRVRLRQLAQMTAERVKAAKTKTPLSSSSQGPLSTNKSSINTTTPGRSIAPAKSPVSSSRTGSKALLSTTDNQSASGRDGSHSFQKACAMLLPV